jgi:tellurite resistance protein TerC
VIWFWVGFFTFVAIALSLDLGVFNRTPTEPTFKSAFRKSMVWIALGLGFAAPVYFIYENNWLGANTAGLTGKDAAVTYLSAYLLEEALSVDNIFVIALIFRSFRVPPKYQHRVLFWGIIGAVVMRCAMLGGGVWLTKKFDFIFYFFGAYLIYSGLGLLRKEDEDEDHMEKSTVVRLLRRFVRIVDGDHKGHFMVRDNHGHRALTVLAVALVVVELTDVVFAMDSTPAVLAVSQETFVIITSNIMAILGLRSLYFMLAGAMAQFDYLKYALAALLVFIGAKMIGHGHVHIPNVASLGIIAGLIGAGVIASIIANKKKDGAPTSEPAEPPAP